MSGSIAKKRQEAQAVVTRSRSLVLVPTESPYATSYWVIYRPTNLLVHRFPVTDFIRQRRQYLENTVSYVLRTN